MRANKHSKGFTLIELIVVMAIMGVLAAIVVPTTIHFVAESKAEKAVVEVHTIVDNIYVNIPNIESHSIHGQIGDAVDRDNIRLLLNTYIGNVEEDTVVQGTVINVGSGDTQHRVLRITAISPRSNDNGQISYSKDYELNPGVEYEEEPFVITCTADGWV